MFRVYILTFHGYMPTWFTCFRTILTQRSVVVKPSAAFLLDLASIVLTNNFFRFQDDFYLQVKGTAMGSKMANNYACLYMGVFENDF